MTVRIGHYGDYYKHPIVSSHGTWAASAERGRSSGVILWNMASGAIVESWDVYHVFGLAFTSENGYLVICSQDGLIFRDPNHSCDVVGQIDVAYKVDHCSWSPENAFCALSGRLFKGAEVYCVGVYSTATAEEIAYYEMSMPLAFHEHTYPIFSNDCDRLLLTQQYYKHTHPDYTEEMSISWIWDIHRTTSPRRLLNHGVFVDCSMFNPADSAQIFLLLRNGTIQVRNIASGIALTNVVLTPIDDYPYSAKMLCSPNGIHVMIKYSPDQDFRLCNTKTGVVLGTLQGVHVSWLVFSPDGRYILSRSHDSAARLWDLYTGRPVLSLEAHIDWIEDASFSPDGKYVATGYEDGTVRLWKVEDGACLAILTEKTSRICRHGLAFSSNGEFLMSLRANGTVHMRHLHDIICR